MANVPISNLTTTWNNVATTFTGIKLNVTDTASAAGSLLMDLQVGGSSKFSVAKGAGAIFAANLIEQRNGVNAQTFRLYNTFTDASNYERGFMQWNSNVLEIGTQSAGTGATRGLELSTPFSGPLVQLTSNTWDFCNTSRGFPAIRMAAGVGANIASNLQFGFNSTTFFSTGSVDAGFKRSAAAIIGVTNGSTGGGSLELQEVTAPASPATNNVRIFAQDNGAGKTQLMALFATGIAIPIATEL
jgi:hypothetical protein